MTSQESELAAMAGQADRWGADIIAQIPAAEIDDVSENLGGPRISSDYYEEWPKYYYWSQQVDLRPDGPRTPTMVADDLEPWLTTHEWKRFKEHEFPPGKESFKRYYTRGGYLLEVQAYTVAPPQVQTIGFTIVTPDTDPHAPTAEPTPPPTTHK